jgi:hypothetical protein
VWHEFWKLLFATHAATNIHNYLVFSQYLVTYQNRTGECYERLLWQTLWLPQEEGAAAGANSFS